MDLALVGDVCRGVGFSGLGGRDRKPGHGADAGDAKVDQLDLLDALVRIAVGRCVRPMEAGEHGGHRLGVDRPERDRHGQLCAHAAVAQIGGAVDPAVLRRETLALEHRDGLLLKLAEQRGDAPDVGVGLALDVGQHVVLAHVRDQRAVRAPHAG